MYNINNNNKEKHACFKQTNKASKTTLKPYAVLEYYYLGIYSQGAVFICYWLDYIFSKNELYVCDFLSLHENKVM